MIYNLRVDERMIHGQILVSWLKFLGVSSIIVANDRAATDPIEKLALSTAVPANIKCLISTMADTLTILNDPRAKDKKIMVITENIFDANEIVKAIEDVREVVIGNYGNIYKSNILNKKVLSRFVRVDEEDIACLIEMRKELDARNIPFYISNVSTDKKIYLSNL